MSTPRRSRSPGFALIEALIALLLISIGLLAVSKLQTASILGAGDGRARADAANLSQQKIEELRNNLLQKSDFTALANGTYTQTIVANPAIGRVNTYLLTWTVSTPDATLEKRQVFLSTTWTDAQGNPQRLDMNTELAYDEPYVVATVLGSSTNKNLISPNGEAVRGGTLPSGLSPNVTHHDGSKIYVDNNSKTTYLVKPNSTTPVIYLPPKNGVAQSFTRISGRVYFDPQGGNAMPAANKVLVRLSSEGECIYNNSGTLPTASSGGKTYSYLPYTCYVGPGWYGNVGVTVVGTTGNNGGNHNVCVGDPGFNSGVSNSTQTSAHPSEAAVRTYRGFRSAATTSGYQSTGVAGGRDYGTAIDPNGNPMTGPFDGRPRPSDYPAWYGTVQAADDYLNQDFLITDIKGQGSCFSKMQGGLFVRNAGEFVCINADAYGPIGDQTGGNADLCPATWPGYVLGTGGSINETLTVVSSGNGVGSVTSSPAGIACPGVCSTSLPQGTAVVLTAMAAQGSTFNGWTSCPSVSGTGGNTCTLTLSAGMQVGAAFSSGVSTTTYPLNVTIAGSGSVTSAPSGISCPGSCSSTYAPTDTVVLTPQPATGQTFSGWVGDCTGTGSCSVTMSAARNVTATFTSTNVTMCDATWKGSMRDGKGSVSVVPSNYGACSSQGNSGNFTCTFTQAPDGTIFTLTNSPGTGSVLADYAGVQPLAVTLNCSAANVNNLKF